MKTPRVLAFCMALAVLRIAAAADADGPYVVQNAAGRLEAWSVAITAQGARKQVLPVAVGDRLTVPAVGRLPPFSVRLRASAPDAPDEARVDPRQPTFVVADTHGEYEILADMLMKHSVVDSALRWSFGRGRLVFLGDALDRGAQQLEILWLIYELEAQARKAGGAVYFVLGNHETMIMTGDLRYMNAKYRETAEVLGVTMYTELFGGRSVLGQWLRSKPTMLKLGDLLCLHGGVSPVLVEQNYTLAEINRRVRAVLNDDPPAAPPGNGERTMFLFSGDGPLWYRGYFPAESAGPVATDAEVEQIRAHFGVERLLVGHTRMPTITPLYGGRVIAVQVYPRHDSFGNDVFESLLIRDGVLLRARPDGRTEQLLP
jgi:calcineurin-like phosphoesterase family protein